MKNDIQRDAQDRHMSISRSHLARECIKLDPHLEQALAEEWMEQELVTWPEY